jgi:hypothetical protein
MAVELLVIPAFWLLTGFTYATQVRDHNKDHKLAVKHWVASFLLGPIILAILAFIWVRLVLARLLNHRI